MFEISLPREALPKRGAESVLPLCSCLWWSLCLNSFTISCSTSSSTSWYVVINGYKHNPAYILCNDQQIKPCQTTTTTTKITKMRHTASPQPPSSYECSRDRWTDSDGRCEERESALVAPGLTPTGQSSFGPPGVSVILGLVNKITPIGCFKHHKHIFVKVISIF